MRIQRQVSSPISSILFVCSGNICRSPMAQALAARLLGKRTSDPPRLYSAGTLNIIDSPADPNAILVLAEWKIDLSRHRSRGLRQFDLTELDAIVVMEQRHVYEVFEQSPHTQEKTWKLWEFLQGDQRIDRIPDPIGGTLQEFRRCRDLISDGLENWADQAFAGNP